jgi:hypothetical protein
VLPTNVQATVPQYEREWLLVKRGELFGWRERLANSSDAWRYVLKARKGQPVLFELPASADWEDIYDAWFGKPAAPLDPPPGENDRGVLGQWDVWGDGADLARFQNW